MATRKKPTVDVDQLLRERLQELGALGGKAAAKKLSKGERTEKARKAADARWASKPQSESLKVHGDKLETSRKPARKKRK